MKTVICEDCGKEFSIQEKFCPVCCWKYPREQRDRELQNLAQITAVKSQQRTKTKQKIKSAVFSKKSIYAVLAVAGIILIGVSINTTLKLKKTEDVTDTIENTVVEQAAQTEPTTQTAQTTPTVEANKDDVVMNIVSNEKETKSKEKAKTKSEKKSETKSEKTEYPDDGFYNFPSEIPNIEKIYFESGWTKITSLPEEFASIFNNYAKKSDDYCRYYVAEIRVLDVPKLEAKLSDMLTGYGRLPYHSDVTNTFNSTTGLMEDLKGYPLRKAARSKIFMFKASDYYSNPFWKCYILSVYTNDYGNITSIKIDNNYCLKVEYEDGKTAFLEAGAKKTVSPVNTKKYNKSPVWKQTDSKGISISESGNEIVAVYNNADDLKSIDNNFIETIRKLWKTNNMSEKSFDSWIEYTENLSSDYVKNRYKNLPYWTSGENYSNFPDGNNVYVKEISLVNDKKKGKALAIRNYCIKYSTRYDYITDKTTMTDCLQGYLPLDSSEYKLFKEKFFYLTPSSENQIQELTDEQIIENEKAKVQSELKEIKKVETERKKIENKQNIKDRFGVFIKFIGLILFLLAFFTFWVACESEDHKALIIIIAIVLFCLGSQCCYNV